MNEGGKEKGEGEGQSESEREWDINIKCTKIEAEWVPMNVQN